MRRALAQLAALVAILFLSTLAPLPRAEGQAAQTLTGAYFWDQGGDAGDLRAEFTPAGEGHWNVAFHFTFQGSAHTYKGTADGQLGQGPLTGRVETDRRRRVFVFRGEFKNGQFDGQHAELSGGREERTGTLTLRR